MLIILVAQVRLAQATKILVAPALLFLMRRPGVAALFGLCALETARGRLVVLAPQSAVTGRELLVTSLKFFGKRRFERNITGEVVPIHGEQQCDRRLLPRAPRLEGAIVVLDAAGIPCVLETVYANLNSAGVALALIPWYVNPPGETYNFHDGSRGRETRGKAMLLLEMYSADVRALVAASREEGSAAVLTVYARPDHNEWTELFESGYWWGLRAVAASLAFATCGFAVRNLRARCSLSQFFSEECTVTSLTLAVEAVVMPVIGAITAIHGHGASSDVLPDSIALFFLTGLTGFSLFTTLALAPISRQHWRDQRDASVHERRTHPVTYHWLRLSILALMTAAVDTLAGILSASYELLVDDMFTLAAIYSIVGLVVAIEFFMLCRQANVDVIKVMFRRDWTKGEGAREMAVPHMIAWLAVSGVFLLANSAGFMVIALTVPGQSPMMSFIGIGLLLLGRIGSSYAQGRSLDPITIDQTVAKVVAVDDNIELRRLESENDGDDGTFSSQDHANRELEPPSLTLATFEVDLGEQMGGIRRVPVPTSATVRDLRAAIELHYGKGRGAQVHALVVGDMCQIDDEDVAVNAIGYGEVITVSWLVPEPGASGAGVPNKRRMKKKKSSSRPGSRWHERRSSTPSVGSQSSSPENSLQTVSEDAEVHQAVPSGPYEMIPGACDAPPDL